MPTYTPCRPAARADGARPAPLSRRSTSAAACISSARKAAAAVGDATGVPAGSPLPLTADEVAAAVLESIPQDALQTVAKFLESQGKKELALELSTDLDFKFELAVQLGRLEVAYDIAMRKHASGVEVTSKWRQLGDLALGECNVDMAEECMAKANDLGGLVLLYSSLGKREGIVATAKRAAAEGKNNIAFMCFFLSGMTEECVELLCSTGRVPEAAFFARAYAPSQVAGVLTRWKQELVDHII